MKKKEIHTPDFIEQKPHITEVLNDHPVIQWIVQNRINILSASGILIVAIVLFSRLTGGTSGQKESDLISTETEFINLQRSILGINKEIPLDESFKKVNLLLKQYPELQIKYDAPLAQAFITVNKGVDAGPFATNSLKRTSRNHLPFYKNFAETTLLISENKLNEALNEAKKLQENLIKDEKTRSVLFAYNTLRIATLNEMLGNKTDELKTWQEWKNQANLNGFTQLTNQLGGLSEYAAHREEEISLQY